MTGPSSITSSASSSVNQCFENRTCSTIAKIAVTVAAIGMTVLTCFMAAGMLGGGRAPFAGVLLSPGMGCISIMMGYLLISENFPSLRLSENWAYGLGMGFGTIVVLSLGAALVSSGAYVPL